jgi:DNA-binding transcriptional LysR family regulator
MATRKKRQRAAVTVPTRRLSAAVPPAAAARRRLIRPPRILTYVDAVARHGSIRKAAEALHMASSALNRRILDLEDELGTSLFERLPRGVRLSAAGELFIGYVRRSLADLELLGSQIEHLQGLVRGRVRIAATESVAGDFLPSAIVRFQGRHPGVYFNVTIGAAGDLVDALIDDTVDLVLTHNLPEHREAAVIATAKQPLCVLVARGHPLAAHNSLRLRDCQDYPIALADKTLAGRALIDRALGKDALRIEPAFVSNSIDAMKAYARMSKAVCFQFKVGGMRDVALGEMVAIPLTDPQCQSAVLVLAMRARRVLPIAAAAFAEELKGALARL